MNTLTPIGRAGRSGRTPDVDALVAQHLDIAHHAVRRVTPRLPAYVSREDLHGAALVGLVRAAQTFDAGRGIHFSSYATRRVEGAILDELRSADFVSRGIRRRARDLERVSAKLANELGRAPSCAEVARNAGLDVSIVEKVNREVDRGSPVGLDTLTDAGDEASDEATPEEEILADETRRQIANAVAALPERLAWVVQALFYDERTGVDVAQELGISPARVIQLRTQALALICEAVGGPVPEEPVAHGPSTRRRSTYRRELERISRRRPVAAAV